MKRNSKIRKQVLVFFVTIFMCTMSFGLLAQQQTNNTPKNFKIVIEKAVSGIKMTCVEGCAWKELTYNNKSSQSINHLGMTTLNKNTSDKEKDSSEFLFTLVTTEKELTLQGIKGTAWTDLSFNLTDNTKKVINSLGMTSL